jgi:hypothetical protein
MRCLTLTLLALIACKEKPAEPPPPAPPHDGVTLIQPGAAPRQALRYHLTPGTHTTSELVCDIDISSDGQSGPVPTLVVAVDTAVSDVLADGTAKLRVTVVRTDVRDRPGAAATDIVRGDAAALRGVVITETLSPDGMLADAHVEAAAKLPDKVRAYLENLSRNLERMAMRFPVEPVGVGATWRERRTLPEGGIRAVSETTYTLTSLTGDVVVFASTGQATAGPQTVEQDGMKAEVTSTRGSSEAKGSVDLSRYAITVRSTSKLTTAMNVLEPAGAPGTGASTIEVSSAIQVTPIETIREAAAGEAPAAPSPTPAIRTATTKGPETTTETTPETTPGTASATPAAPAAPTAPTAAPSSTATAPAEPPVTTGARRARPAD